MTTPKGAAQSRRGLSRYEPGCEQAIYDFQRVNYPRRTPATILPRWQWLFLDSSRRLDVEPMVWLYWKDGRIVAHQGAMPVRLHVGDSSVTTGWFVETMAAEEVRGSPIGPMLVQKALSDLPLNLSLGQTEQMRDLQYALGWKRVAPLNTYLFVCSLSVDLRGKLPPVIAESAAFAVGLRHAWLLRRHAVERNHIAVRRVSRFDHSHDDLWRGMAETVSCGVVRDSSYLNWKYVDRPDANFVLLELSRDSRPVAVCVLMVAAPAGDYPYSRGFIVDLVARLDDRKAVDGALAASISTLKGKGAKTVTFYVTNAWLEQQLVDFGFIPRGERHVLLVSTRGADEQTARALLDPNGWYLTMGDSDADAYPG